MNRSGSLLDQLAEQLDDHWPAIQKARITSEVERQKLEADLKDLSSPDTTVVVFGSVARGECTAGSDRDWILLIDGQADHEHKTQERLIADALRDKEPGASGLFGTMVSGHDLVHYIGGEDDKNSNTTRRVLMLIESLPVGSREAYDRVRRQVLKRYVEDDRGLRWGSSQRRIPRFLLNDLTRYWRTVTVDFVYKQRASDKKWALRNAKLRMSRKLVFAAGLLRVYFCALDDDAKEARESLCSRQPSVALLLEYMERQLALTPLELVAKACLRNDVKPQTARDIFQSYDRFLALLDDPDKREALAKAKPDGDLSASPAWMEVSKISRRFHAALLALFLQDDADLRQLTMEYGIF